MDSNIYYSPEKFGLTTVAEIEYSSGSYEFDTRVVWKDQQGKLFTDRDSGCSCPTPFEDSNLTNIDPLNYDELSKEVSAESHNEYHSYLSPETGQEFLAKVREAMRQSSGVFSYISGR